MTAIVSLTAAVRYCERGASLSFWAEPVNAVTNAAFLVAAALGWRLLSRAPMSPSDRTLMAVLVAIAATIGVGSAAFHTVPSPLTKLADVIPIAAFVTLALYLALTRAVALPVSKAIGWLIVLACAASGITAGAQAAGCGDGACLNGAPAYLPVLLALAATSLAVHRRGSPSFKLFAAATTAFALSLAARTLDHAVCPLASIATVSVTAHAFWHMGTALTAYLVIRGLAAGMPTRATS